MAEYVTADFLKQLGMDTVPADKQAELLGNMNTTVHQRVELKLSFLLSGRQLRKFNALGERGGDAEGYLRKKVSNLDLVIAEVVQLFKEEMVDLNTRAQGMIDSQKSP